LAKRLLSVQPSGGGGPFSPADLAGLEAWWDASDAGSITSSAGAVSQWDDLSGNAHHVSQGGGTALRPTTGASTINSLNVIDFNGNDYLFRTSAVMVPPTDYSVIAVIELSAQDDKRIVAEGNSTNSLPIASPLQSSNSDSDELTVFYRNNPIKIAQPDTGNSAGDGLPHLVVSTLEASVGVTFSVDSAIPFTESFTGGLYAPTVNRFCIGGLLRNTFGSGFVGAVAELVIVSGVITGTDLTDIEDYLSTKWGTP
jgi:hypothetical protein